MALRIIVKKNNKWGVINKNNEVVAPFIYDEISKSEIPDFSVEVPSAMQISVRQFVERKAIICNTNNPKEVVCSVFPFKTRIGNKVGLINCLGKERVPCILDGFERIKGHSFLLVSKCNDKFGLIYCESIIPWNYCTFHSRIVFKSPDLQRISDVISNSIIHRKEFELLPAIYDKLNLIRYSINIDHFLIEDQYRFIDPYEEIYYRRENDQGFIKILRDPAKIIVK